MNTLTVILILIILALGGVLFFKLVKEIIKSENTKFDPFEEIYYQRLINQPDYSFSISTSLADDYINNRKSKSSIFDV